MTGAFSRNISKLFSELKLVTDNLLFINVARLGEALVLAQSYLANPLHLQEISYIKKKKSMREYVILTNKLISLPYCVVTSIASENTVDEGQQPCYTCMYSILSG